MLDPTKKEVVYLPSFTERLPLSLGMESHERGASIFREETWRTPWSMTAYMNSVEGRWVSKGRWKAGIYGSCI